MTSFDFSANIHQPTAISIIVFLTIPIVITIFIFDVIVQSRVTPGAYSTYRCFDKLWTPGTDKFNTLKDIDDLNNFDSVHKIRNCDVSSTSSSTITEGKMNVSLFVNKSSYQSVLFQ